VKAETLISALALPTEARVDQRVPKKLFLEQGAPTPADKRIIQDGIDEVLWIAAVKPTNAGVSAHSDYEREYLEIAVLSAAFHAEAKTVRLTELVHRAIPYPVVLVVTDGVATTLSLAHKRWSQGEAGKVVLEDRVVAAQFGLHADAVADSFVANLALSAQPTQNLYAVYQGWIDLLLALAAARVTGAFATVGGTEETARRQAALDEHGRIERDIADLRARAGREKQMSRRVEINLNIKKLEADLAVVLGKLQSGSKA
jgi:hypothetical protein